jgi:hypothetical protein
MHAHKRIRLQQQPVKLLAALESTRLKQRPRIIKRRWRSIVCLKFRRRCWRGWKAFRERFQIVRRRWK